MTHSLHLSTLADLVHLFGASDQLQHPLVAVVDFNQVSPHVGEGVKVSANFYSVMFKNSTNNTIKYGRQPVDFRAGNLICMAPHQIIEMETEQEPVNAMRGWGLFFHPDLIRGTYLGVAMNDYSFFSYETAEALHLSAKEKQTLDHCLVTIQGILTENVDGYSQAIIITAIELLLNYGLRFYGRQFITRKTTHRSVVAQVEKTLRDYFSHPSAGERGLPTVKYLAEQVHLSPSYLSDLLKKETGQSAQDQIHYVVIEEAKNLLLHTDQSVAQTAYRLGFDYPQYFHKLFKQKTGKTPLEFRHLNLAL